MGDDATGDLFADLEFPPVEKTQALVEVTKGLPAPYYEDKKNGIVLYHGDCLQLLGEIEVGSVDLLTDPHYGIGEDGGKFRDRKGGGHRVLPKMNWDRERPPKMAFDLMLSVASKCIIWGGNYFADLLPPSRGWLYWDKLMGGDFSDGELAWTNMDMVLRKFTKCNKGPGKEHPTQKPVELMLWCLSFIPASEKILDCYCGSGTTGVACIRTERSFIGMEIEEKYCEIAARRFECETKRTPLFPEEPNGHKQLILPGA